MEVDDIEYRGVVYRRYPDARNPTRRNYYRPLVRKANIGRQLLHRDIWIDLHGPIPNGCVIHHKDENPLNNDPSNLVCETRGEHTAHHIRQAWPLRKPESRTCIHCGKTFTTINRSSYNKFCGTKCKKLHRFHSGVDNEERICGYCGGSYSVSRFMPTKCCSRRCGQLLRHILTEGVRSPEKGK